MLPNHSFPYRFKSYEIGVYSELYLPKKAQFQGVLYETLTKGFDLDHVKRHLLDPTKRDSIYDLLEEFTDLKRYSDERITAMEQVFGGYSLYEVDGVFYNASKGSITEERTQIVRMMFFPNIPHMVRLLQIEHIPYRDVRAVIGNVLIDIDRDDLFDGRTHDEQTIIHYLREWRNDIGLLLLGYIIFEICSKIIALNDNHEGAYEDEIWLTSFWELNVNRINVSDASKRIFTSSEPV